MCFGHAEKDENIEIAAQKYVQHKYENRLMSTRIKDAGIAIRHSQGYIISILQGPEMSLGAVDTHLKS